MNVVCPILERPVSTLETAFSRDVWQIVQCEETGFVFLSNPPEYQQLEEEFAWEKTQNLERQRRAEAEPVFQTISQGIKIAKLYALPKRNKLWKLIREIASKTPQGQDFRILDVGCGSGHLLDAISRRFQESGILAVPFGIEVSNVLAAGSNTRFQALGGHVVSKCAIDGVQDFEPASIQCVVLHSFLEHEAQPVELLRKVRNILTPDGAVVLKVPNFDCWNRHLRGARWCGFRYPDHVNYFTPKTLGLTAARAGFRIARQNLRDKFPLSDNMYAVLQAV